MHAAIRIFISSPKDVRPERIIAARVVERLARAFAYRFPVSPVLWEREPLLASQSVQSPENIPLPSSTDIVVVILWRRLGVPLAAESYAGPISGRVPVTGTEWEFEEALAAARAVKRPSLLFYRKESPAFSALDLDDEAGIAEEVEQRRAARDFVARWFSGADGAGGDAAYSTFEDAAGFESQLETHLKALLQRRAGEGSAGAGLVRWHAGSPFRGLQRFEPEHEPIFAGRTRAREALRHRLAAQSAQGSALVCVVGASGSGKSSLLRAGLVPDLLQPGMIGSVGLCRVAIMEPDAAPIAALVAAVLAALPELADLGYDAKGLAAQVVANPAQLDFAIRQGLAAAGRAAGLTPGATARLLLVVDQLEKLFTTSAITGAARAGFAAALEALAHGGQAFVVATLRSDFSDRLESLGGLARLCDGAGRFLLLPPDEGEIAQIIRKPAEEAGLSFEVAPETGVSLEDVIRAEAAREPGALPLLEFTLDLLWQARTAQGVLTYAAYAAMGRLAGAIAQRAEAVLQAQPAPVQAALPSLLRRLATVGQAARATVTARDCALADLPENTPAGQLARAFLAEDARLLVTDETGTRLRVAHETLLTVWPTARASLQSDLSDLQTRARVEFAEARWRAAAQADAKATAEALESLLLPPGLPLSEAEDLRARRGAELSPEVLAYVAASVAAEAARQERRIAERLAASQRLARRTRAFAGVLAALLLASIGVTIYAVDRRNVAQQEQRNAEAARDLARRAGEQEAEAATRARIAEAQAVQERNQAQIAESIQLAGHSQRERDKGSATTAALLALEALPARLDKPARPLVPQAEAALARAMQSRIPRLISPSLQQLNRAVLTADGRRVVALIGEGANAGLWDAESGRPLRTIPQVDPRTPLGHPGCDDPNLLLTKRLDSLALHWLDDSRPPLTLAGPAEPRLVAMSGDCRRVLAVSGDNRLRVWDGRSGQLLRNLPAAGLSTGLLATPDGRLAALLSPLGDLSLIDLEARRLLLARDREIATMAFDRAGTALAVALTDGAIALHDTQDGGEFARLEGHSSAVTSLAFTPDGSRLLSASTDRTVRIWEVETGLLERTFVHHGTAVRQVIVLDGERAVSADDGTAIVWNWQSGARRRTISTSPRWIRRGSLAAHGDRLLLTTDDHAVEVHDISAFADVPRFEHGPLADDHGRQLNAMGGHRLWVSPGGRYGLASSPSNAEGAWLYDLTAQRLLGRLDAHGAVVIAASFSADGTRLLTGGTDGTAILSEVPSLRPIWRAPREGAAITVAELSRDGRLALIAARDPRNFDIRDSRLDGPLRLLDAATGRLLEGAGDLGARQRLAQFIGAGDRLAALVQGERNELVVWEAATLRELHRFAEPTPRVFDSTPLGLGNGMLADSAGREILMQWRAGLSVLSLASGEGRLQAALPRGFWSNMVAIPGTERVAIGSWSRNEVMLLDTQDRLGGAEPLWTTREVAANRLALSPDARSIAVGTNFGDLVVLDAATGTRRAVFGAHSGGITGLGWAADGRSIVSTSNDGSLAFHRLGPGGQDLIDLATLRMPRRLEAADREVLGIAAPRAAAPPLPEEPVARCDALAGNAFDPDRVSPGVVFDRMDQPAAEAACRAAMEAQPGDARLTYQLGRSLTRRDALPEAHAAFAAAAEGHRFARFQQARDLLSGSGVPADVPRGLDLVRGLAEAGFAPAQDHLGMLHRDGRHLPMDRALALDWLSRAAAGGYPYAALALGEMLTGPEASEADLLAALGHYRRAEAEWEARPGMELLAQQTRERRASVAARLPDDAVIGVARAMRR